MNENEALIDKNRGESTQTVVDVKETNLKVEELRDVTFWEMTKNLSMNIIVYLMYFFSAFMEVKFVGNTKDLKLLNGLNLGTLYRNLFVCFFYFGMTQSITINCSKSFGRKDYAKIGHQTNQVRIITFVLFLLYLVFTFSSGENMLKFIAGDKAYVKKAHEYILWTIPGVFLDIQYDTYFCYAQAQLLYLPVILSVAATVITHPTTGYIFIIKNDYGMWGVVLAYNIACLVKASVMFFYFCYFTPYPKSHIWFRKECFEWTSFKEMLLLSFSCMMILYAEYSGLNILIILSNNLAELSYSIIAIIITIVQVTFYLGLAWITTNSAMIGFYIGKNSPDNIRTTVKFSFYLLVAIIGPFLTFMFIYKKQVFFFIGHNEALASITNLDTILTITVFIQAFTILHSFFIGVLRECELVNTITYVTIAAITVFMPAICYVLVFKLELDVAGLLGGMLASYMLTSFILFGLYLTLDYEKVCERYKRKSEAKLALLDEESKLLVT
jgi:Na+-driven multidrug efflux pump